MNFDPWIGAEYFALSFVLSAFILWVWQTK